MMSVSINILTLFLVLCLLFLFLKRFMGKEGTDLEKVVREELRKEREEFLVSSSSLRNDVMNMQKITNDTLVATIGELGSNHKSLLDSVIKQVKSLTDSNERRIKGLEDSIVNQLKQLQEANEKKLEQMRQTVDEKLQSTLEKRLGESFKAVSERLEAVQRGLGEMHTLAVGVGDLKRVLTNVKTRGTWGEVQLGELLSQILTPDQYGKNVCVREGSLERVEYAIRLPGADGAGSAVWLPIDSKFPQEDYQRLIDAADRADEGSVARHRVALRRAVESAAKEIMSKYLNPPGTTDFAIMFMPTEGLYSEVLRQPGLVDSLQQRFRVVLSGPTTLSALLNSLRMGFRTLAIEKRSSEVWQILAAVKTEFGKFGDIITKVKKQLNTASDTLELTGARTRAMARKLREVESLPDDESNRILGIADNLVNEEQDDIV